MTKTQKLVLKTLLAKGPATPASMAGAVLSCPGPMARCMNSLLNEGLVKAKQIKATGQTEYSLTAEGKKLIKAL